MFISQWALGQNLVPNSDFEEYYKLPTFFPQLENYVKDWYNPDAKNIGGTTYFNINGYYDISFTDNVKPFNGIGIVGLINCTDEDTLRRPKYRSYLGVEMSAELKSNHYYYGRMYVRSNFRRRSFDRIGMFFSKTKYMKASDTDHIIFVDEHIGNPPGQLIGLDTFWHEVQGCYQAEGGEKYLIIGNFSPIGATILGPFGIFNPKNIQIGANSLIDHVSVEEILLPFFTDTIICLNDFFSFENEFLDLSLSSLQTGTIKKFHADQIGDFEFEIVHPKCGSLQKINIKVQNCQDNFYAPNIFSPNNDNVNDTWLPILDTNNQFISICIYNRWGARVFFSNELTPWDGKFENRLLDPSVYVYHLLLMTKAGKMVNYFGDITLVH